MYGPNFQQNVSKGSIFILFVAVVLSTIIFYIDIPSIPVSVYIMFVKSHIAFVIVQLYEMHQKLKFGFEEVNRNLVKIVDRYDSQIFTVSSILPFVEIIGRTENSNHLTIPVLIDLHWTLCKTVKTAKKTSIVICELMNKDLPANIRKQIVRVTTTYLIIFVQQQALASLFKVQMKMELKPDIHYDTFLVQCLEKQLRADCSIRVYTKVCSIC
ncbi:hypothetical protein LSTR_LSTR004364 [Laodelphax striatellus]|uniref:Uncharacterized protein n=1 Tax=Laodelphax striatellus TaxID=195883 RepID=A0A482X8D4_LAOST|nr:hypothetical protein LSTR_LSTR004364 [Laodelphax striatellus]